MVKNLVENRENVNADQILESQERLMPYRKIYHENSQSVVFCSDKLGRPVHIDRWSAFNTKDIIHKVPKKETVELLTHDIEYKIHCVFPYLSMLEGKRIDSTIIIHDLKDFALSKVFDSDFKDWFGLMSKIAQDNYPEMIAVIYIVNSPWIVNLAYALAKTFLNENTRKKVQIMGSNYEKTLFKTIDKDKLPDFLGGTVKGAWPKNNHVPWKKYQDKCIERKSWFSSKDKNNIVSDPLLRGKQIREELNNEENIEKVPLQNEYENKSVNCTIDQLNDQIFTNQKIGEGSSSFRNKLDLQTIDETDEGSVLKMFSTYNISYSKRNTGVLSLRNLPNKDFICNEFVNDSSKDKITKREINYSMKEIKDHDLLLDEEIPDEWDVNEKLSIFGIQSKSCSMRMCINR